MKPRTKYNLIVLIIFHVVGLILFATDPNASRLSYVTLLISGAALIIDEGINLRKAAVLSSIFVLGYSVELIGIKTGFFFGEYSYDTALGSKFLGVPLIIGLNWVIIVAASSSIIKYFIKKPLILQALLAAALCTLLDFIIEPIAISYNFWTWTDGTIPFYNYLCWFGFSFLFSTMYLYRNKEINKTGIIIYIIWTNFFIILSLL
ncbi:carotenoid biosynthesis protein [Crocinitomicaceae bacterium]|nr:carotenoid biosynthesis protein [Crocinitomicaceae bacterium]MDC1195759.1 carotenoid biosynthesis protein [Crocinitomicaceae bacterium]MDC1283043.1 carotenoid biosynthesis protein [Crocinitomicaceae bacterium]|tara:strand:- start:17059 stop:17673 length:615 start_codon:yes stop_codon:yes gene_type:complete